MNLEVWKQDIGKLLQQLTSLSFRGKSNFEKKLQVWRKEIDEMNSSIKKTKSHEAPKENNEEDDPKRKKKVNEDNTNIPKEKEAERLEKENQNQKEKEKENLIEKKRKKKMRI